MLVVDNGVPCDERRHEFPYSALHPLSVDSTDELTTATSSMRRREERSSPFLRGSPSRLRKKVAGGD